MALTAEQQALDFNPELQDVSRQRKLADLLMSQGMQQPQGQMISGYYVAPSWTQQLNPIANILAGQAVGERADVQQTKLAEVLRTQGNAAAKDVMDTFKTDPQAALAKASQYSQFPQVKALIPQLSKSAMPEATTLEREFAAAKSQGYPGTINDFKNQLTEYQKIQAANEKQRLGLESARLGLEQQKLAAELGGAKLTETQGNAVAFGTRAKEANAILTPLENAGTTNTGLIRSAIGSTVGMTPLIGQKLEQNVNAALNFTASQGQQATDQARRNFITAVLRKESGASIPHDEYYNEERKYFPQPNDDAATIRQKQNARETAIKALEIQAGPGARFIQEFKPKTDFGGAKKVVNFNDLP